VDPNQIFFLLAIPTLIVPIILLGGRSLPAIIAIVLGGSLIFQSVYYTLTTLIFTFPLIVYSWLLWNLERFVFPKNRVREAKALAEELVALLGPGWRAEPVRVFWEEPSPARLRVWTKGWKVTDGTLEVVVVPHEVELREGGKYWLPSLPRFLLSLIHERSILWMPFASFRNEGAFPLHGGYLVVGQVPLEYIQAQMFALSLEGRERELSERLAKKLEALGILAFPLAHPVYLGDTPSLVSLYVGRTLVLIFPDEAFVPVNAKSGVWAKALVVKWKERQREGGYRTVHKKDNVHLLQVEGDEEVLLKAITEAVEQPLK
jgi:hypothetical protein